MRSFFLLSLCAGAAWAAEEASAARLHAMITAAPAPPSLQQLAARQAAASCDAGETACTDTGCCPIGSPCTTSFGKPVCGGAGAFCATTCDDGFCCGIGKVCTTDTGGQSVCGAGFGSFSLPKLSSFSGLAGLSSASSGDDDNFSDSDSFTASSAQTTSNDLGNIGGGSGGAQQSSAFGGGINGGSGGSTPTKTIHQGSTGDASKVVHEGVWGLVMLQVAAIVGVAAFVL